MYFPKREELSFRVVFEFPKDSMIGFVERTASSISLLPPRLGVPTAGEPVSSLLVLRVKSFLAANPPSMISTIAK
jgi:hypothetical protein